MATTETALGLEVTHEVADPNIISPHALNVPTTVNAEFLLSQAIDKNVSIDALERLIALRERINAEQARAAFFTALAAFQRDCPVIPKTKTATIVSQRGSYKYSYAPLDVIVKHTSPILAAHGLSVTFNTGIVDGTLLVSTCTVHHLAGHCESSDFRVPIDAEARMNDAQKVASASTYAKRYAYCNALGILTGDEDDDAGALGGGATKPPFTPPRRMTAAEATIAVGQAVTARLHAPDPDSSADQLPPLSDAELAALDTEDARAQGSAAGPTSDPPVTQAQPVVGPCISAAQVKRAHGILGLACKGNEAAAKLARAQLYLQLTKHVGVDIEDFAHIPKAATETYRLLCDEWIDKAATWALKHVEKKA
jgi:hypothetical protein